MPASPPPNRRRQRSVRVVVAIALLAVATAVVLAALLAGGALLLGVAAVVAWAAGVAASRILSNELAVSRREHARERAEQAQAYSDLEAQRTAEQVQFAATMRQKVEDHATTIRRLRATLRLAEKRAEFAEQAADRNRVAVGKAQREVASLKQRITELEAELGAAREAARNAGAAVDTGEAVGVSGQAAGDGRAAGEQAAAGGPAAGERAVGAGQHVADSEPADSVCDLEALQGLDEAPTVVDLLEWDERAEGPAEELDQRKHA